MCVCQYIWFTLIHHGHKIFCYAFANIYEFRWSIMDINCVASFLLIYNFCWSIMDMKCLICFRQYIWFLLIHHGHKMFCFVFACVFVNIYDLCFDRSRTWDILSCSCKYIWFPLIHQGPFPLYIQFLLIHVLLLFCLCVKFW